MCEKTRERESQAAEKEWNECIPTVLSVVPMYACIILLTLGSHPHDTEIDMTSARSSNNSNNYSNNNPSDRCHSAMMSSLIYHHRLLERVGSKVPLFLNQLFSFFLSFFLSFQLPPFFFSSFILLSSVRISLLLLTLLG